MVCFQPPSLLIGKVWVPVMYFCACPMHCRVHWSVGRRLGSCRLISVQPLIGSTIWAFSVIRLCSVGVGGSVLSILTQFLSNRSQHVMVDGCRSKQLNVVSGVQQAVFWAHYCTSCTLRSFFTFWKRSGSVMLMTPLWWLLCYPQASELQ